MRLLTYSVLLLGSSTVVLAQPPNATESQPYEILRKDAAWCGPRVLFFFAWYTGRETSLDKVVGCCQSDSQGYTTLFDLVQAAHDLGLNPNPIAAPIDSVLDCNGPCILSMRNPSTPDAPVHFVGYVRPHEEPHRYWIIDPSMSMDAIVVDQEILARSYTGEAVLLCDAKRPLIWPKWLAKPFWGLVIGFFLVLILFSSIGQFLKHRRLKLGKPT